MGLNAFRRVSSGIIGGETGSRGGQSGRNGRSLGRKGREGKGRRIANAITEKDERVRRKCLALRENRSIGYET